MKLLPLLSSAALLLAPIAVDAPASADQPTVSGVVTSSQSTAVYSMVTISGNWHVDNPTTGDSFTVELGKGLTWPTGTSFPLTEKTSGTTVATCTATADTTTLTCTFNEASEQWDTLDGTFQARAQINGAAIGTSTSTIVVAGAEIPVNFAGTIVGQGADPTTYKGGWYAGDVDGGHRFDWYINVSGATDYRVSDPGATVRSVQCTDADWPAAYAVRYAVNGDVTTFSAPSTTSVCRVKVSTVTAESTTSNTATVNGTAYSAKAVASANGSGEGDGSNNPKPVPTPEATTPAPEPTNEAPTPDTTTPAPTPTSTPTEQSWPTPSSPSSSSSPSPRSSSSPAPSSSPSSTPSSGTQTPAATPSSRPSSTTPTHTKPSESTGRTPRPSSTRTSASATTSSSPSGTASSSRATGSLAHTGTSTPWFIAFAVTLIGAGVAVTRTRKH